MTDLWKLFSGLIPVVSAFTWAAIMALAAGDGNTRMEKRIKKLLLWYFLVTAFAWIFVNIYIYLPAWYPYINAPGYFTLVGVIVIFYHFICLLTAARDKERFPLWHYVLLVLLPMVLMVWSFFVPMEVQVRLTEGRDAIVPEYRAYSYLFLSKPPMRLLFSLTYTSLSILRLRRYYRVVDKGTKIVRRPARWVLLLISLQVAMLLVTIIINTIPRGNAFVSWISCVSFVIVIALHIVIGYNVIRRNILFYMPQPSSAGRKDSSDNSLQKAIPVDQGVEKEDNGGAEQPDTAKEKPGGKRPYTHRTQVMVTPEGQVRHVKLTRKSLEAYMLRHKPWLDPHLKITDLTDALRTNRTTLSNFVNKAYGMNFNQYLNLCRLQEVERLRELAGNAGKDLYVLVAKAGFSTRRNYHRTLEAEKVRKKNRTVKRNRE
jgi:AraC-like DNA-binding protein